MVREGAGFRMCQDESVSLISFQKQLEVSENGHFEALVTFRTEFLKNQ